MTTPLRPVLAASLLAAFLSCGPKPQTGGGGGGGTIAEPGGGPTRADVDVPDGLTFRLGEGRESMFSGAGPLAAPTRIATGGAPLSKAEAEQLLARLQALKSEADDQKDFALRERSQPPPRPGQTIKTPFPPPAGGGKPPVIDPASRELTVLRHAPDGDVPLAPHLSITFSLPMIAVTSHDDAVKNLPVKLSPQPRGKWRWVGTQTLLFDPDPRFPQATSYTVDIPAGTKAATGELLKQAVQWKFTTPAPRLVSSFPTGGPHERRPVLFAQFDQAIDPAAVLATIAVSAGGKKANLRLATAAELAKSEPVAALVAAAKDSEQTGRWLAFTVTDPLPTDTQVSVTVGPGTPSKEGPRTTGEPQSWTFRTYGPFKVVHARCYGDCPPGHPWQIEFTNPIDVDAFEGITLKVNPDITRLKSWVSHNYLTVQGRGKGRTTYTLTVPGALRDQFGQVLGKDEQLTFNVGSAYPYLHGPQGLVVLDPAAVKPSFDVFSTNFDRLHVEVWKVDPVVDWPAFLEWQQRYYERKGPPPGKKVIDARIQTKGQADAMVETAIDLAPALDGRFGHAIVMVTPEPWKQSYDPPMLRAWVQATGIGLDAFVDGEDLHAWATRLDDGRPLAGVKLSLAPTGGSAPSDGKGLARLPLPAKDGVRVLYASRGKDTAFLPQAFYYWDGSGGWRRNRPGKQVAWHVFDDRGMYRPGEKVRFKGWLRTIDYGKGGDVGRFENGAGIDWELIGPQGNKMGNGKAALSALGGFDLALDLPKTPNLGYARLVLTVSGKGKTAGNRHEHGFQIQEFRRPEFQADASVSQGPHYVGGTALATVKASYYAGGPLAGSDVHWQVTSSTGSFTPPNRDGWTFGTFVPYWHWRDDGGGWVEPRYAEYEARTDATGQHVLKIDLVSLKPPRPMQVTAQATVIDVNRQPIAATTMFLVHPASLYVGLKTAAPFVEAGKAIDIDAIAVDLDGKAVPGTAIKMRSVRMDWKVDKGVWKEVEEDPQSCTVTSTADAARCTFKTGDEGGRFVITAEITDKQGRVNESEMTVWVAGGEQPPERNVTQEQVMLIPDKQEYRPGETAQILVQAPFYPAEGLLSLRRSGMVSTTRFQMTGPTTTLKVPVVDGYTPNVWAQVDLIGSAPRVGADGKADPKLPRRPAFAMGQLDLAVPPHQRTLGVKVLPRDSRLEPGGKTSLAITVTDAGGRPVAGAELAVVVVDEAVLALSSYQLRDPLGTFYPRRGGTVDDYHQRAFVTLARPELDALGGDRDGDGVADMKAADDAEESGAGGAPPPPPEAPSPDPAPAKEATRMSRNGGPGGGGSAPIAVRTNFDPLAVFMPAVATGADGKATVPVKLPDNLTRYRVMVVAVAGDKQFGKGESAITARMPLMVRPSPPRFLNFGDHFELPVVLQNQTDAPMAVRVAVRGSNLALTGHRGFAIEVPANDRLEIRFDAAAEMPGTARLQVAAASDKWADAAELALPVWTPATTEAFATYGTIEAGAVKQPVAMPADVQPAFGGLEITTSSTQLQALTDAFLYLVAYPYECAEQVSSRVIAVAALRDVLTAFKAEGLPPPAEIEASVKRDLDRLSTLQNHDGGFGFWRRGDDSWPYPSVHVAHALVRAQNKKYDVPKPLLAGSLGYLREIRNRIPGWYPEEVKRTLEAYALYVRKLGGNGDPARARNLLAEGKGIEARSLEAVGWIYGALAGDAGSTKELAQIRRHLDNKATETAGAAHFVTGYGDGGYLLLHSDRRVDGIVLESLLLDQPRHDLVPKVVRGLLGHRKAGRWENTQENAFVLLALDRYFHEYEKVTPNFVARAWLGDKLAGEHTYKGRQTDYQQIDVPMAWLATHKAADLTLSKDGAGRLYYRIGMTYAPRSLRLDPADHGFTVQRVYEAVDKPGDVSRQADGTWKIRAGARVRVKLTMVAQSRRYHVALVDPLPAGLEAMNPALATTGAIPQAPSAQKRDPWWWWTSTWYEHQNLRDERVEAFASLLWEGVHEYSYVARATTPGSFVVPPAKAEEMYHPETFGRSASDKVLVE